MIPGLLLTGTIAAGKTTVATATSELLHERRIRHALIEFDWLGQVYPAVDEDDPFNDALALRNLAAIWANYRAVGADHVLLTATVEHPALLGQISDAMPDVAFEVCLVSASGKARAERIGRRDRGRLKADFLERTDALAETIRGHGLHGFEVVNQGDVTEVALRLVSELGWD